MKIYAPVKDVNGMYASVKFVNGVGETDNPHLIEWFKTHGYAVEGDDTVEENVEENTKETLEAEEPEEEEEEEEEEEVMMGYSKPDFEKMTPNEIRDWAKSHGYGSIIRNTRSKDKLIELLKG